MNFREFVALIIGRDISESPADVTLLDLGFTSKEMVILLMRMEREFRSAIPYEVLAQLATIASFEEVFEASR
jgi:acyl carrier protein